MKEVNDGGPAFPIPALVGLKGITARDYFAIRATKEDIERFRNTGIFKSVVVPDASLGFAGKRIEERELILSNEQARYAFADAMLHARENT